MDHPARESSLLFDPPAARWGGLVRALPGDAVSRATREALGLPTDRPVVMGGHQPGFWHPGILAKWFAVEVLSPHIGAAGAWVVVDQSPGAGGRIGYPALEGSDGAKRLARQSLELGDAEAPPAAQPAATDASVTVPPIGAVAEGLRRMRALLDAHASEPSLGRQLHAAALDALGGPTVSCFASGLSATPAAGELLAAMREDPRACAAHYNNAAAAHPDAGVRALDVHDRAVELPLWERSSGPGPWRTVTSDRLADLADERLVFRGLPMTGLLRSRACDLFVHGTGGGASGSDAGYDRVTEQWFREWLGVTDLAPAVVASATLRLDFGDLAEGVPDPDEIARARELAHRAEHDPALLGDEALGQRKRELAERIAALPRGSDERAEIFAQMQELREQGQSSNAERLEELRDRADRLAERAEEAEIIADRAWPWPLYSGEQLDALRAAIEAAFAE